MIRASQAIVLATAAAKIETNTIPAFIKQRADQATNILSPAVAFQSMCYYDTLTAVLPVVIYINEILIQCLNSLSLRLRQIKPSKQVDGYGLPVRAA